MLLQNGRINAMGCGLAMTHSPNVDRDRTGVDERRRICFSISDSASGRVGTSHDKFQVAIVDRSHLDMKIALRSIGRRRPEPRHTPHETLRDVEFSYFVVAHQRQALPGRQRQFRNFDVDHDDDDPD